MYFVKLSVINHSRLYFLGDKTTKHHRSFPAVAQRKPETLKILFFQHRNILNF